MLDDLIEQYQKYDVTNQKYDVTRINKYLDEQKLDLNSKVWLKQNEYDERVLKNLSNKLTRKLYN